MTAVAGIDIGNTTTEVVLLDVGERPGEVVAHDRRRTRGRKGSAESVLAAARLVARLTTRHELSLRGAVVSHLAPVRTTTSTSGEPRVDTRPLRVLTRRVASAHGDGWAVGVPIQVDHLCREGNPGAEVIAVVPAHVSYAEAAEHVEAALRSHVYVCGVVAARDEAVLIGNRLSVALPVIDQTPSEPVLAARLVAMEVRPLGQSLSRLVDPYWLADHFRLPNRSSAISETARCLADSSEALVLIEGGDAPVDDCPVSESSDSLGDRSASDDYFSVRVADITAEAQARRTAVPGSGTLAAELFTEPLSDPAQDMSVALGVPTLVAGAEVDLGRRGALTTPGCPGGAVVVDIGGGTIDISNGDADVVLAGAGNLLTRVVSVGLAIPSGVAEHAKRGAAVLAAEPQVLVDEDGGRSFTERPLGEGHVGALCVGGPVGLVPFSVSLELAEWRAWRRTAKRHVLGHNLRRGLATLDLSDSPAVLLAGGGAGDDELVAVLGAYLPERATVGRADVAGRLGHRHAVSYGLALRGMEEL